MTIIVKMHKEPLKGMYGWVSAPGVITIPLKSSSGLYFTTEVKAKSTDQFTVIHIQDLITSLNSGEIG